MKLIRKVILVLATMLALAYIAWDEIRIQNLQRITDLTFDAASCCQPDAPVGKVDACLAERGYAVRTFSPGVEIVHQNLILGGWSFRRFGVLLYYDKQGRLKAYSLTSLLYSF